MIVFACSREHVPWPWLGWLEPGCSALFLPCQPRLSRIVDMERTTRLVQRRCVKRCEPERRLVVGGLGSLNWLRTMGFVLGWAGFSLRELLTATAARTNSGAKTSREFQSWEAGVALRL